PASNSNFRNQNYQQQQPQQPQQNRQSGYGNRPMQNSRAPYTNSGIRTFSSQQEAFPENTPENDYCNGSDQDQCDFGGQDQYGPNDNADENYFENDQQRYNGEQMQCSNDVNMALQGSAENTWNMNQGENVPIYSQMPFQPEPPRMEYLFQLMTNVDQKVTGMDQRVTKMEQKRSQSQNQNFRLSYAEGNIPMQSGSKLHSTSSQPQMASEMQGKHSATSDGMENKQQNQHQSRKMRQDFCEDASHS
ncbi:MAG: hypothetical protein GY820_22740, partial [Gammaproteobacteria bacterium]|nr:hypothetical protein [Gammaproteobacteria bacterium]